MDFGISQKVAKYIIRPPRAAYQVEQLGPSYFRFQQKYYERIDFEVFNYKGEQLECSLFEQKYVAQQKDTIIFLHANSSSRLAVKNYLADLLPYYNIATLDFSGSGMSDGNYVTLGYQEKEDLRALVITLNQKFGLKQLILWGRSMGAVTGLLYAAKYKGIKAVIADNAFSDLQLVCKELKDNVFSFIPDLFVDTLLESAQDYIKENIEQKIGLVFQLKKLKPIQVVKDIEAPVFYIYSQSDRIVNNAHSKRLFDASRFPKRIMSVQGYSWIYLGTITAFGVRKQSNMFQFFFKLSKTSKIIQKTREKNENQPKKSNAVTNMSVHQTNNFVGAIPKPFAVLVKLLLMSRREEQVLLNFWNSIFSVKLFPKEKHYLYETHKLIKKMVAKLKDRGKEFFRRVEYKMGSFQIRFSQDFSKILMLLSFGINLQMSHQCYVKSLNDLLICLECLQDPICCSQCFRFKHMSADKKPHQNEPLSRSDTFNVFKKIIHYEWLSQKRAKQNIDTFEIQDKNVINYLLSSTFYQSKFYQELFIDEEEIKARQKSLSEQEMSQVCKKADFRIRARTQYEILKSYYNGNPQSFDTLQQICQLLLEARTSQLIKKYTAKLLELNAEEQAIKDQLDYYQGAHIYFLQNFIETERDFMAQHVSQLGQKGQTFSIYSYLEWREKPERPRDVTYYTKQFTTFLIETYQKDPGEKQIFTLEEYTNNYWQYFNYSIHLNQSLKGFIQEEEKFFNLFQGQMKRLQQQKSRQAMLTYTEYRLWRMNQGLSQFLPYLNNHYFLFAFLEGYFSMKIQRSYWYLSEQEKQNFSDKNYLSFMSYIKDFSLYIPKANELFEFGSYKQYFYYRQKIQGFHQIIKNMKELPYQENAGIGYLNECFKNNSMPSKAGYKKFCTAFKEKQMQTEKEFLQTSEKLKKQLEEEEKQKFYQFIYINFVSYCKENEVKLKKQTYKQFKQNVLDSHDEQYLEETQERFLRGDFEEGVEEQEERENEKEQERTQGGAKVYSNINEYEEEVLEEDKLERELSSEGKMEICFCCHGDPDNCQNQDCQIMGVCTACCL